MYAAELVRDLIVAAILCTAVWNRIHTGKVPNWLALAALGTALPVQWTISGFAGGLPVVLLGGLVGLVIGVFLYWMGLARGGDVKLLVGLSTLMGSNLFVEAILATAAAGLVLGLAMAMRKRMLVALLVRIAPVFSFSPLSVLRYAQHEPEPGWIPLTVLIAIGGFAAILVQRVVPG